MSNPPEPEPLNPDVRNRIIGLANQIMALDKRYHARHGQLTRAGVHEYNIKTDPLLRDYSGATKTLSDMCTALSLAYMIDNSPEPE